MPDAARPLSCVLYIRVSTKLQVEKGKSIDAQRFELTRYAENHDMHVLGEYIDSGFQERTCRAGHSSVQRMITNPVYIGKIAYGRSRTETIEGTRNLMVSSITINARVSQSDIKMFYSGLLNGERSRNGQSSPNVEKSGGEPGIPCNRLREPCKE